MPNKSIENLSKDPKIIFEEIINRKKEVIKKISSLIRLKNRLFEGVSHLAEQIIGSKGHGKKEIEDFLQNKAPYLPDHDSEEYKEAEKELSAVQKLIASEILLENILKELYQIEFEVRQNIHMISATNKEAHAQLNRINMEIITLLATYFRESREALLTESKLKELLDKKHIGDRIKRSWIFTKTWLEDGTKKLLKYQTWSYKKLYTKIEEEIRAIQKLGTSLVAQELPMISIIVPVHNHPAFVERSIQSALAQSYPNFEVVIVDDASDTETKAILDRYKSYPRIRLFHNDGNLGISRTQNRAIAEAHGQWIAHLDCDDELLPNALEEVGRSIAANPDKVYFYTSRYVRREGDSLRQVDISSFRAEEVYTNLLTGFFYPSHLKVIRKDAILAVGGYEQRFDGLQDVDLAVKISELHPSGFFWVRVPLYIINMHGEQYSQQSIEQQRAKFNSLVAEADERRKKAGSKPGTEKKKDNIIRIYTYGLIGDELCKSGVYSRLGELARAAGKTVEIHTPNGFNSKFWDYVPNVVVRRVPNPEVMNQILNDPNYIKQDPGEVVKKYNDSDHIVRLFARDLNERLNDPELHIDLDDRIRPYFDAGKTQAYVPDVYTRGIVIAPFSVSGKEKKEFDFQTASRLYRHLESRGFNGAIVGSAEDCARFREAVPESENYVMHAGQSFEWVTHLLVNCQALISADNGVAHWAAIFDRPELVSYDCEATRRRMGLTYNNRWKSFIQPVMKEMNPDGFIKLADKFLAESGIASKHGGVEQKKILYITDKSDSMLARWRACWPTKYLHEYGFKVKIRGLLDDGPDRVKTLEQVWSYLGVDVEWADIVVFQRTVYHTEFLMKAAKERGKLIGYDIDDLIFTEDIASLGAPDINVEFIHKHSPLFIQFLREADFVTVSGSVLQSEARKYNAEVYIVKNRIDTELAGITPKQDYNYSNQQLRIGWVGGYTHKEDLLLIKDVIKQVCQIYGGRVTFVFKIGIPEVIQTLRAEIPGIRLEEYGYSPENDCHGYYRDVQSLNVDVMVAPLLSTLFNEAKSELKYLEAGLLGIPLVASRVGEMKVAIQDGENGFLATNHEEFLQHLRYLIDNPKERERIGRNARKDIERRYNLHVSAVGLYSALQGVWQDKLG